MQKADFEIESITSAAAPQEVQMSEAQKGRAIKNMKSGNGERLHNVVEPFPQRNYRLPNDITNTYSLQKRNI